MSPGPTTPIGATTKRITAAGSVVAGPVALHWMVLNPSAVNAALVITYDVDGLTATVMDHFYAARNSHDHHMVPPMEFKAGIYVKTLTNFTSIILCYT